MNGIEIPKEEGLKYIEKIFNKPVFARVFGDGILILEIGDIKDRIVTRSNGEKVTKSLGDYSVMIGGAWTISDGTNQIHSEDFIDNNDDDKIVNNLGNSEIISLDMLDKTNPVSFSFSNGSEIFIQTPKSKELGYFLIDSRNIEEQSLELNPDQKFIKKPRK